MHFLIKIYKLTFGILGFDRKKLPLSDVDWLLPIGAVNFDT
jgi:hypothetical protein